MPPNFYPHLCSIPTDCQNSFTDTFSGKCTTAWLSNNPWRLNLRRYTTLWNGNIQKPQFRLLFLWGSYSRRCRLRWTTSGCSSDARPSTLTVVDSSPTDWQLDDSSDSWQLQRSLSRDWLSICRHTRCHVSSRQLRTICFSASTAVVRSSMNRWYCCSTREHELPYISCMTQHSTSCSSTSCNRSSSSRSSSSSLMMYNSWHVYNKQYNQNYIQKHIRYTDNYSNQWRRNGNTAALLKIFLSRQKTPKFVNNAQVMLQIHSMHYIGYNCWYWKSQQKDAIMSAAL